MLWSFVEAWLGKGRRNSERLCGGIYSFHADGKAEFFANRTLPDAVYVTVREDQPVNLCGAFEKPIPKSAGGYAEASKKALESYAKKTYETFAEAPVQSFVVGTGLAELGSAVKLQTLFSELEKTVTQLLENEVM